ncbi:hypothetical protein FORC47_p436 (plasmid) [Bacillus cereus]|nr:hypothetical protein FORC47_p436 [Bacillus cereus]
MLPLACGQLIGKVTLNTNVENLQKNLIGLKIGKNPFLEIGIFPYS